MGSSSDCTVIKRVEEGYAILFPIIGQKGLKHYVNINNYLFVVRDDFP